jgi:hypothetical protein
LAVSSSVLADLDRFIPAARNSRVNALIQVKTELQSPLDIALDFRKATLQAEEIVNARDQASELARNVFFGRLRPMPRQRIAPLPWVCRILHAGWLI